MLAPNSFLALGAVQIDHFLIVRRAQLERSQPVHEGALLGVADVEGTGGGREANAQSSDARVSVALECERLRFFADHAAAGVHALARNAQRPCSD